MKHNSPLISIIIPTYNRADLIPETLESILAQTAKEWECIIVDDGSTDETWTVLQYYAAKDPRFKIFKREDFQKIKGANACRNIGIEKSGGEYLIFFDSDDLMTENCISDHLKFINSNNPDLNILQSVYFGDEHLKMKKIVSGNIHSPNLIEEFFRKETVWITHNPAVSKTFLTQHQIIFDESLKAAQDWEFFMKILVRNPKIISVENIGTKMRIHNESISGSPQAKAQRYYHYYLSRNIIYHKFLDRKSQEKLSEYYKNYSNKILNEILKSKKHDWAEAIIQNESKGLKKLNNMFFLLLCRMIGKGISKIKIK